jgi:mono/diheme cytochrome c family protein
VTAAHGSRRSRTAILLVGAALLLVPLAVALGQAKKLNPYNGKPEAVQQGRALYLQNGCGACHGVMGGGGMGMPLLDDVWKFGSDDETLFKLIKGQIPEQTMPKIFGHLSDDDVWKMIAYIRSIYQGDPSRINW